MKYSAYLCFAPLQAAYLNSLCIRSAGSLQGNITVCLRWTCTCGSPIKQYKIETLLPDLYSETPRVCRSGVYVGHQGEVLQLLCLGNHLLSLGTDRRLLLWKVGGYDEPQVLSGSAWLPCQGPGPSTS